METAVQEELLTVKEVAGLLKMSRVGVREMARNGGIPALKVGSDWRFIWSEVMDHFRSLTTNRKGGG